MCTCLCAGRPAAVLRLFTPGARRGGGRYQGGSAGMRHLRGCFSPPQGGGHPALLRTGAAPSSLQPAALVLPTCLCFEIVCICRATGIAQLVQEQLQQCLSRLSIIGYQIADSHSRAHACHLTMMTTTPAQQLSVMQLLDWCTASVLGTDWSQ